ncbi:KR domain-containing protein [Lujinxingia vulgaris]|nr:KR domain-containing protein [Lujinxingia vulgaris]
MDRAVVMVVGGYGEVGRRVSAMVAALPGVRVIVGGRREEEAQRFASELYLEAGGVEVGARQVDVGDRAEFEAAIADVDVVVMCVDVPDAHAALAARAMGSAGSTAMMFQEGKAAANSMSSSPGPQPLPLGFRFRGSASEVLRWRAHASAREPGEVW